MKGLADIIECAKVGRDQHGAATGGEGLIQHAPVTADERHVADEVAGADSGSEDQVHKVPGADPEHLSGRRLQLLLRGTGRKNLAEIREHVLPVHARSSVKGLSTTLRDEAAEGGGHQPEDPGERDGEANAEHVANFAPFLPPKLDPLRRPSVSVGGRGAGTMCSLLLGAC